MRRRRRIFHYSLALGQEFRIKLSASKCELDSHTTYDRRMAVGVKYGSTDREFHNLYLQALVV